jgi:hypothetical protein
MVPGAVRTSVTLVVQYIGNTVVVSGYVFVVLFLIFSGGCPPKKNLLTPLNVQAHPQTGSTTGFLSGFEHPLSGWDYIFAMVAVGWWGAQLGAPAIWALPVAFPMATAFGGMLGLMGAPLPSVEVGIAISALALGAVVLAECRPPLWVAAVIVGFFALFHGHAHGTESPPGNTRVKSADQDAVDIPSFHARRRFLTRLVKRKIKHQECPYEMRSTPPDRPRCARVRELFYCKRPYRARSADELGQISYLRVGSASEERHPAWSWCPGTDRVIDRSVPGGQRLHQISTPGLLHRLSHH